jgi:nitric-oxide synthase
VAITPSDLTTEAREFLELMARETGIPSLPARLAEIRSEIEREGTYQHTDAELEHGAKVAWRNSTRCIGRLHWKTLIVRDLRHLDTPAAIFDGILEHLRLATNGGRIRPMISIFPQRRPGVPGIRIWNPQLVRYAGYRQPDGSVTGDPQHVEITEAIQALGWRGLGGPFDFLPIVIQMPGERPAWFELPEGAVLEVPLSHPELPWFEELGLRWHALPAISNMRVEIGGVSYTAAPFNGWYMGTEIGARNLSDVHRYDQLPVIARHLGLDMRSERTLWRDRALVELNAAVLHSFRKHGVLLVDHHTASRQFVQHEENEREASRDVPGDWSWLVPPLSGSTSPIFHRRYQDVTVRPSIEYQPAAWTERRR